MAEKSDRERIERLEQQITAMIALQEYSDAEIKRALLELARGYVWRQGLWARVRFAANVIGILGIFGGSVMALVTMFGFEVVRR